ncbi:hypothetical protein GCM10009722_34710 [Williamsia deligens]
MARSLVSVAGAGTAVLEINFAARPNVGTDRLRAVAVDIRRRVITGELTASEGYRVLLRLTEKD